LDLGRNDFLWLAKGSTSLRIMAFTSSSDRENKFFMSDELFVGGKDWRNA
jgi:hypothetical protein